MGIYSIINVEKLKLFEPSKLDEDEEILSVLHSVKDLQPNAQGESEKTPSCNRNSKRLIAQARVDASWFTRPNTFQS
jgi:hypothetical protein